MISARGRQWVWAIGVGLICAALMNDASYLVMCLVGIMQQPCPRSGGTGSSLIGVVAVVMAWRLAPLVSAGAVVSVVVQQ